MTESFNPYIPSTEYTTDELLSIISEAGPVYRDTIENIMNEEYEKCKDRVRDIVYEYAHDIYNRGLLSQCVQRYESDMRDLIDKIKQCGSNPEIVFGKVMYEEGDMTPSHDTDDE